MKERGLPSGEALCVPASSHRWRYCGLFTVPLGLVLSVLGSLSVLITMQIYFEGYRRRVRHLMPSGTIFLPVTQYQYIADLPFIGHLEEVNTFLVLVLRFVIQKTGVL